MLMTRWGEIDGKDDTLRIEDSMLSVWIKIVASWICYALYAWIMLAPAACPDREFGSHV